MEAGQTCQILRLGLQDFAGLTLPLPVHHEAGLTGGANACQILSWTRWDRLVPAMIIERKVCDRDATLVRSHDKGNELRIHRQSHDASAKRV